MYRRGPQGWRTSPSCERLLAALDLDQAAQSAGAHRALAEPLGLTPVVGNEQGSSALEVNPDSKWARKRGRAKRVP
jgi:hypothetical protein